MSTTSRGYGHHHQQVRASFVAAVATGTVPCARCKKLIPAGAPWDLGHDDNDRNRYTGPECRPCNRATAGRRKSYAGSLPGTTSAHRALQGAEDLGVLSEPDVEEHRQAQMARYRQQIAEAEGDAW